MLAQSDYRRAEKQERLDKVKEAYETIINEHQCVSLKTLAVTGKDLIEAGYKPGREIGETLNRLLEVVLVDPPLNHHNSFYTYEENPVDIPPDFSYLLYSDILTIP